MASIQSEDEYSKEVLSSHTVEVEEGLEEEDEDDVKKPLLDSHKKKRSKARSGDTDLDNSVKEVGIASKRYDRRRWLSIYIMYFTMFMSAVTFSIVLSSVWPYLLQVDYDGATATFLGWVVAAYSFGQLIASPALGLWADYRPTREPLIFSLIINIVFNILYSYSGAFPTAIAGWVMLISRGFVGFGAGIAAVVRSYVSEATLQKERTGAMAGISAAQALGFIIGPALGLAFVPLGSSGAEIRRIKFAFNMYTGPGYLGALLGVANVVLLVFLFKEFRMYSRQKVKRRRDSDWEQLAKSLVEEEEGKIMNKVSHSRAGSTDSEVASVKVRKRYDMLAAVICVLLFFGILFVFSVFETIATPLSMDEFAWSKSQGVLYNNAFFAGLAVIAVTTFIVIKFLSKKVDERVVFMVGLFFIAFGFFTLIPMGDIYPKVSISGITYSMPINTSGNIPFRPLYNHTAHSQVGCREAWCPNVPAIYLFQYVISLVLIAIGYPAASVLCYAIFSKILGPFPQGTMMGFLTAAGSLARCIGPLSISALYHVTGPEVTFATMVGLVALLVIILLVFSYRLIPYNPSKNKRLN